MKKITRELPLFLAVSIVLYCFRVLYGFETMVMMALLLILFKLYTNKDE